MNLERHPLYRRAEQIFRLTLRSPGWLSAGCRIALKTALFAPIPLLFSAGIQAQESAQATGQDEAKIVLGEADCRALIAYTDTGAAAYQPGVDVHGRPVVSANVSTQSPSIVPDEVIFTLTLRLGDFVPNIANELADSSAPIGEIAVRGQEVFLNDHALNALQTEALAEQCDRHLASGDDD